MSVLKKKLFFSIIAGIFIIALYIGLVVFYYYTINRVSSKVFTYNNASTVQAIIVASQHELPKPLENPPAILKAVYVTAWSAGSKKYLDYLQQLFETTQINAVVIDVKDALGIVSYNTGAEQAQKYGAYRKEIPDINALITQLHSRGIYVIGRVVVFEDPVLAKNRPDLAVYDKSKTEDITRPMVWENNDGLAWVDPAAPEVWDYNVAIAKDAATHGFDEINFDYVRFPTDGDTGTMGFPVWNGITQKNIVIKSFFQKLRQSFPDTKISVDIFGQTTTNTDDMGIGQIFEDSLSYFDYVCPMVYPSHYTTGFLGYKNPADHPYQIVTNALGSAVARKKVYGAITVAYSNGNNLPNTQVQLAKIRPWLQDFNLGAEYTADMVTREIKAAVDAMGADFNGYLLWNPSNIYTQEAMLKDTTAPK